MPPKKAAAAASKPAAANAKSTKATKPTAAAAKVSKAAATKETAAAAAPAKRAKAPAKSAASKTAPATKPTATKKSAPAATKNKVAAAAAAKDTDKENESPASDDTNKSTKRKREEETAEPERPAAATAAATEQPHPVKKAKRAATPKAPAGPQKPYVKIAKTINSAPKTTLDVFVFGEGTSGELGLGSVKTDGKKPIDVKRPRLNAKLPAQDVGVVQIACGGMHAVALTKEGKILSWGVNDQGALGRNTTWDGGLRSMDQEGSDSEDEDDTGMNPHESTPGEIDLTLVATEHKFVKVAASDSASFALTEDGRVYSWGTFRASDGILGFSSRIHVQRTPILLDEPRKITDIVAGSNHVMALDVKGKVFTWGCPEQNQLGRRCVQRDIRESALRPGGISFKRGVHIKKIACGSYHSFALDDQGRVYAWGLNNFAELGIEDGAGDADAVVLEATLVDSLGEYKIKEITGGEHHSLACTTDGKLLTWGRIDGHQVGLAEDKFTEENTIFDERSKPRILKLPTVLPDLPSVSSVASGTDHSFALTQDGQAYSWGFSANYQTGQGSEDDVLTPTLIDNTAVRGKKLVFAGAGGQYSILASESDKPLTNGSA